jgi:hypothetical protein
LFLTFAGTMELSHDIQLFFGSHRVTGANVYATSLSLLDSLNKLLYVGESREGESILTIRAFSAATRTCECASKIRHTVNTTAIDGTEWRGDSFCDKIMRGYHEKRLTNPLEKAWTERCTNWRILGQNILNVLRFQSVPPDIIYNPRK